MSMSLEQIDAYIDGLTLNATALISEAEILISHAAYARTFALAHLAREELSKCLMLHSAGISILTGLPVDFKNLSKRLRDHKSKLVAEHVQNTVMVIAMEESLEALDLLPKIPSLAKFRNERKNDALYVGFEGGKISVPSEQFTKAQAKRTLDLAKYALQHQTENTALAGKFSERKPFKLDLIDREKFEKMDLSDLVAHLASIMKTIKNRTDGVD